MFCSQPVPEELQNGDGFGYIIAFRPAGAVTWTRAVISTPGVSRYIFRNDTIPPFSPFDIKVGAYNNRGEGPFSTITTVYSAEDGNSNYSGQFAVFGLVDLKSPLKTPLVQPVSHLIQVGVRYWYRYRARPEDWFISGQNTWNPEFIEP